MITVLESHKVKVHCTSAKQAMDRWSIDFPPVIQVVAPPEWLNTLPLQLTSTVIFLWGYQQTKVFLFVYALMHNGFIHHAKAVPFFSYSKINTYNKSNLRFLQSYNYWSLNMYHFFTKLWWSVSNPPMWYYGNLSDFSFTLLYINWLVIRQETLLLLLWHGENS